MGRKNKAAVDRLERFRTKYSKYTSRAEGHLQNSLGDKSESDDKHGSRPWPVRMSVSEYESIREGYKLGEIDQYALLWLGTGIENGYVLLTDRTSG